MKKTLLAASLLAGFAGAAQAQSNVTLYGLVDAGFNYTKLEGQSSRTGIDSGLQGQSRWGIRGSEDIGGGLKAIFTLENGFTVDNGQQTQGRLFGRYAFVGLESAAAGRVTLGRTTNLAFMWAAGIANPFGLSFSSATVGSTFGYNDADLGLGRVNNSIYYYSPNFSGFQGAIGYSFQSNPDTEVAGSKNNDRLVDLGLKYDNGPLKAVVTYQYLNPSQLTANNGKFKNLTLGANYDFGVVAVYAGYANAKGIRTVNGYNGAINATSADFTKDNAYTIGLSAPLGPGKAYAAYQKATKSKTDNWAIGYTYDLSKRTNLYAFYVDGNVRNFATKQDLSNRQFALGLQHRF
ncbi:porin [Pigmentiphaga sp.]|uniref:porin n=1 Tax=Pigmentiphaga sp. TaxID=1977564 RepID=UPI00128B6544|nr:porin [Pigmentiphaga sp.]MPS29081.1 porin [Alcaligenaceae bacterium SAGV5]MPS52209.1 porin [Alcaligenaceae bacterium SAGV3]MPT57982.1 porin [Alcaligenaceae bacterium]